MSRPNNFGCGGSRAKLFVFHSRCSKIVRQDSKAPSAPHGADIATNSNGNTNIAMEVPL